jgi:hypothetical protein
MNQVIVTEGTLPSNLNSWLRDMIADANKEPGRFTLRAWLINGRVATSH